MGGLHSAVWPALSGSESGLHCHSLLSSPCRVCELLECSSKLSKGSGPCSTDLGPSQPCGSCFPTRQPQCPAQAKPAALASAESTLWLHLATCRWGSPSLTDPHPASLSSATRGRWERLPCPWTGEPQDACCRQVTSPMQTQKGSREQLGVRLALSWRSQGLPGAQDVGAVNAQGGPSHPCPTPTNLPDGWCCSGPALCPQVLARSVGSSVSHLACGTRYSTATTCSQPSPSGWCQVDSPEMSSAHSRKMDGTPGDRAQSGHSRQAEPGSLCEARLRTPASSRRGVGTCPAVASVPCRLLTHSGALNPPHVALPRLDAPAFASTLPPSPGASASGLPEPSSGRTPNLQGSESLCGECRGRYSVAGGQVAAPRGSTRPDFWGPGSEWAGTLLGR